MIISKKRGHFSSLIPEFLCLAGTFAAEMVFFCRFSSSAPSVRCPDGGFSTRSAEWFSTRCLGLYGSLQGGLFGWMNWKHVLWCEDVDGDVDVDVDEKRGWFFLCALVVWSFFFGVEMGVSQVVNTVDGSQHSAPALEASLLLTGRSLWQFPGLRWAWCWWRWRVDWCCIVNLYILRLGGWVGNMWCFDVQLDTWESTYFFLFWTHESNFYLVGDGFFRNLFGGRNHCQKPQVRFLAVWFVLRPAT